MGVTEGSLGPLGAATAGMWCITAVPVLPTVCPPAAVIRPQEQSCAAGEVCGGAGRDEPLPQPGSLPATPAVARPYWHTPRAPDSAPVERLKQNTSATLSAPCWSASTKSQRSGLRVSGKGPERELLGVCQQASSQHRRGGIAERPKQETACCGASVACGPPQWWPAGSRGAAPGWRGRHHIPTGDAEFEACQHSRRDVANSLALLALQGGVKQG